MSAISTLPRQRLEDAVCLADTGTWGEDAGPGGGAPVLRSSNIQDGHLVLEDVAWRDVPGKHRESKLLVDGDLIVTMSSGSPAHIGKCCVFTQPFDNQPYYFSNFTLRLRAYPDVADPRWLFHWLSSPGGRAVLDAMNSTTSGLRNLNRKLYLAQKIPLPPLPEQRRIAAILDKADAVRRKRQQTLDLTDQFLRSAFLDMFGDPVTNPKRWPVKKLGRCLAEKPRIGTIAKAEDDAVLRVVRVGDLGQMWLPISLQTRVTLDQQDIERFRIEPGDFLLARAIGSEGHLGKASIVPERGDDPEGVVVFDSHVMRLRFDESTITCEFFWQWLKTPGGRALFMRNAGRTAVQFNINATQIARISIAVPPESLQHQFVQITRNVREMALAIGIATAESGALFDSLVQRAFRGGLSK